MTNNSNNSSFGIAQLLLVAFGVGFGAAGIYYAVKAIKKGIEKKQNEVDNVKDEIVKRDVTLTSTDLDTMCQGILEASNGQGTNMEAIVSILTRLKTTSDFWALVKKFGVRELQEPYWGTRNVSLIQLFEYEFEDSWFSSNRKEVQSILSKLTPAPGVVLWADKVSGLGNINYQNIA